MTYGDVAYLAFKQPTYFIIYDDSGEGSKNVLSTDLSDKFYVLDSSYEKLLNKVTQDNGYWCSKDKVLYTDQEKNMLEEREDSEKRWKLGVGIGVGIGVPILAVICFWLGRWFEGKKVGDRRMKSEGADGIPLSRTSTIRGLDSHVGRA